MVYVDDSRDVQVARARLFNNQTPFFITVFDKSQHPQHDGIARAPNASRVGCQ